MAARPHDAKALSASVQDSPKNKPKTCCSASALSFKNKQLRKFPILKAKHVKRFL